MQFQLRPDTFFQVNTEAAEALLHIIVEELQLQGHERLVDAYCGIGTFTLPLARRVGQAISLEVQPEAIAQAQINVKLNQIENVQFQVGKVEKLLPQLEVMPDIVLLDPPRQGCDARTRLRRSDRTTPEISKAPCLCQLQTLYPGPGFAGIMCRWGLSIKSGTTC